MARKKKPNKYQQPRNTESYRRIPGKRIPRKAILIVCEGKATEPNYFSSFRNRFHISTIEMEIIPEGGSPITIVDKSIRLRDDRRSEVRRRTTSKPEYDEVWCIFDTENPANNETLSSAIEKASCNKINLGISNPAFEYWYLIHFVYTNRPFRDAGELKQELSKYITNYTKSINVFPLVFDKTPLALENSKRCHKNHTGSGPYPNSSTTVHRIVEEIISMVNYKF